MKVIQFIKDIVQVIQFIEDIVQVIQFIKDIVQVVHIITYLVKLSLDQEVQILQIPSYPSSVVLAGNSCPYIAGYCTQSSASH